MSPPVVMISGANRGIGAAILHELAGAGYRLSLGVRRPSEIERLRRELGADHAVFAYEAADADSPRAWVAATVERFGRLDAVVNSAGILRSFAVTDPDESVLDEMLEINLKAPLRLIRHALPHLESSRAGRVVSIVSLAGLRVSGRNAGYAMSKHAMMALMHAVRLASWDQGVRATAICPGFVNTDMLSDRATIDPAQMTQPADIARLVLTTLQATNAASMAVIPVNCQPEPLF